MANYKANSSEPPYLAPLDPGLSVTGTDPDIAPYTVDWTDEIAGSAITGSAWNLTGLQQPAATGQQASILAGNLITQIYLMAATGSATGATGTATNQITVAGSGAKLSRSFKVKIETR